MTVGSDRHDGEFELVTAPSEDGVDLVADDGTTDPADVRGDDRGVGGTDEGPGGRHTATPGT